MGKINSRTKGAVGERELAKELNALLGCSTRRGQQYSGLEGEDVVGLPGIHIECKRVEKLNVTDAVEQAVRDAANKSLPVLFHRKNRAPWLVTVRLDDLVLFAKKILEIQAQQTSQDPVVDSDKNTPQTKTDSAYNYV
jgi:hypothetical protein